MAQATKWQGWDRRMSVSKRKRFEVFKRDRFTCQYCGRRPPDVVLHCDHVHPSSKGGTDDRSNLVTSCDDCNLGKSDGLLTVIVQTEDLEQLKEKRDQLAALDRFLAKQRRDTEKTVQVIGTYWYDRCGGAGKYTFGRSRVPSVRTFLDRLPATEIYDSIDIAHARYPVVSVTADDTTTWKYFCGICWRKIREAEGSSRGA